MHKSISGIKRSTIIIVSVTALVFMGASTVLGLLSAKETKDKVIRLFHEQYIQLLLRESGGNISRTSEMAGIQRQYLHRLMK